MNSVQIPLSTAPSAPTAPAAPVAHTLTGPLSQIARQLRTGTLTADMAEGLRRSILAVRGLGPDAVATEQDLAVSDLDLPLVATMAKRVGWGPYRNALAECLETASRQPIDEIQWTPIFVRLATLAHALRGATAAVPGDSAPPPDPTPSAPTEAALAPSFPVAAPRTLTDEKRAEMVAQLRAGLDRFTPEERETADNLLKQADTPGNEWCAGCDAVLSGMVLLLQARLP